MSLTRSAMRFCCTKRVFHEHYVHRYDWAYHAYDQFINGLETSIQDAFKRKDQVTVVLYGHTQAGKTTVLLKLLGIKEEYYDSVSKTLRGGRPEGNSATATATVYTKSPFPTWSLTGSDNKEIKDLTDDGMLARLTEIRGKVNEGTYEKLEAIHVAIPECYFDPTPFDKVGFQIIDLPGTCCENENERRLVAKIANEYVPYADMVLIVNDAAKMTYLQSENMVSAALSTWYIQPERFHLILTKAFSISSVKEAFAQQKLSDAESIRRLLLKELQHTLKPNCPSEDVDYFLFPVDCGNSWQTLKKTEPAYFKQIEPIINAFFLQLTNDIVKSATKIGRVRMAGSAKSLAEKTKETRMKEYDKAESVLLDKIKKVNEDLGLIREKIKNNQSILTPIQKLRKELDSFEGEIGYPDMTGACVRSATAPYKSEHRLSNVMKYLEEERSRLATTINRYLTMRNELDSALNLHPMNEGDLGNCRRPLDNVDEDALGGGIIIMGDETYWTDSGYIKDCDSVSNASQASFNLLRAELSNYLAFCEGVLNQRLAELESNDAEYHAIRTKLECEKNDLETVFNRLIKEKERFLHDIDETIKLASRFYDFLDSEYRKYYEEQKKLLHECNNPFTRFYHLCFLKVIQQTRKDIVSPQNRTEGGLK